MKCEHYIGIWIDFEDTGLVTNDGLRTNVKYENACVKPEYRVDIDDYYDRRKNVNLIRFNYCPKCGEKLDWRKLKHGD